MKGQGSPVAKIILLFLSIEKNGLNVDPIPDEASEFESDQSIYQSLQIS